MDHVHLQVIPQRGTVRQIALLCQSQVQGNYSNALSERFTILASGNVGINTVAAILTLSLTETTCLVR